MSHDVFSSEKEVQTFMINKFNSQYINNPNDFKKDKDLINFIDNIIDRILDQCKDNISKLNKIIIKIKSQNLDDNQILNHNIGLIKLIKSSIQKEFDEYVNKYVNELTNANQNINFDK